MLYWNESRFQAAVPRIISTPTIVTAATRYVLNIAECVANWIASLAADLNVVEIRLLPPWFRAAICDLFYDS